MSEIIGIDFGTSTTVISRLIDSAKFEPEIVEIHGNKVTDSVIRLSEDGSSVEEFGIDALEELDKSSDRIFYNFKADIGTEKIYKLPNSNKTISPEDLSELFLNSIKDRIENDLYNGIDLKTKDLKTVIGYPADWNEKQKLTIIKIAEKAGFPNVSGCDEPIGVVYYHHYKGDITNHDSKIIFIFDFGGGSTDIALVKVFQNQPPKIIATTGLNDLGGRDFDELICNYFIDEICDAISISKVELSSFDTQTIRKYAITLKEKLSNNIRSNKYDAECTIPILKTKRASHRITLSKNNFDQLCSSVISEICTPINKLFENCSIKKEEVDISILAGGSARFHFVYPLIEDAFPNDTVYQSTNPQEVVSKGLALHGLKSFTVESKVDGQIMNETTASNCSQKISYDLFKHFNKKQIKYSLFVIVPLFLFYFCSIFLLGQNTDVVNYDSQEITNDDKSSLLNNEEVIIFNKLVDVCRSIDSALRLNDNSLLKLAEYNLDKIEYTIDLEESKLFKEKLMQTIFKLNEGEEKQELISKDNLLYSFSLINAPDYINRTNINKNFSLYNYTNNLYRMKYYLNYYAELLEVERPFEEIVFIELTVKELHLPKYTESFRNENYLDIYPDPSVSIGFSYYDSDENNTRFVPLYFLGNMEDSYEIQFENNECVIYHPNEETNTIIVVIDSDLEECDYLDHVYLNENEINDKMFMENNSVINVSYSKEVH